MIVVLYDSLPVDPLFPRYPSLSPDPTYGTPVGSYGRDPGDLRYSFPVLYFDTHKGPPRITDT